MKKVLLVLLGVFLLTSVMVLGQEAVKNPNTIVVYTIPGWDSLDPAYAYDTASGELIFNLYENLIDYVGGSTSQFKPMLATVVPSTENGLITIGQDGKTTYIDFPIRKGVKFHNGDVLTPQDVAFSFWRLIILDVTAGPAWMVDFPILGTYDFSSYVEQVAADLGVKDQFDADLKNYDPKKPETYTAVMKKVDTEAAQRVEDAIKVKGDTVEFRLPNPVPYFLSIVAHSASWCAIVDQKFVASRGGWDGNPATWRKYHDPQKESMPLYNVENGTGPWKLESLDPTAGFTLVRNDDYWNKAAYPTMFATDKDGNYLPTDINKVVEKYVTEWSDRRLAFQNGDCDIVYVPRQYKAQVMGMKGARTIGFLPSGLDATIFFNFDIPTEGNSAIVGSGKLDGNGIPSDFFLDKNVRLGFEYAFDWKTFIQQAWLGEAVQARGPIVNSVPYYNPNQPVYHMDLAKAAQYFKQAFGGKLWKVGFKMTIEWNTGNDVRKTAAEILADNLRKINPKFQVSLASKPWGAGYLDDYKARKLALFIIGWLWDYPDPDDWATPYVQSQGTYGGRVSISKLGPISQKLDALVKQGATSLDPATRKAAYYEIQKIAHDEAIAIFLVDATARHWERTWVNNYEYNAIWPGLNFSVLSKKIGGQPNYNELLSTLNITGAKINKDVEPGETVIGTWDPATKTANGIVIQEW